jgi:2-polyprenyl-3-methyl-5-hydroxy-6-metoxy-1,4-benzoquinol methylase
MTGSDTRTSIFFDSYAHEFDAIYGTQNTFFNRLINQLFRQSMKLRYEKTLQGCSPIEGKSVLDIGCGSGHYSIALALAGAGYVLGLDFAKTMIDIASQRAQVTGVAERCHFEYADFFAHSITQPFDYTIVMGFMDYMQEPERVISKVMKITRSKAFFSFPAAGSFLAWQRKLRYKQRCDLFLYDYEKLHRLFEQLNQVRVDYVKLARDYFVTVHFH